MGSSLKLLPALLLLAGPALAQQYNVGHAASPAELAQDITISPTGENLPMGSGTAKVGAQLFVDKGCSGCHGDAGKGGVTSAPALLSAKGPEVGAWDRGINIPVKMPVATIGFDFINRAMPLGNEGSLKPDEVYSLIAYLMANNKMIPDDMVVNQDNLAKIKMPIGSDWKQVPGYNPGGQRYPNYPY
jgi:cytochrome c